MVKELVGIRMDEQKKINIDMQYLLIQNQEKILIELEQKIGNSLNILKPFPNPW